MIIQRYAENAVRVIFGNRIDLEVHEKVRRAFYILRSLSRPGIRDIIPSYCSCVLVYDEESTTFASLQAFLEERLENLQSLEPPPPRVHDIPTRYGGKLGPDLPFVSSHTKLSVDDVIDIHCSTLYTVFTVGFTPGFPYLGILDARIEVPRLETPRTRIPAGSVGIAQRQTGIYPFASPAGWQIIGHTDVKLFDPYGEPYSLMQIGDKVRFKAII
jgi:inhibitor of KinA